MIARNGTIGTLNRSLTSEDTPPMEAKIK